MNNKGKMLTGTVVSTKTPQTVIVTVESTHRHPLYKKLIRRTKRMAVHNSSLTLVEGDTIRIQETKPISRTKHFIAIEKIAK